MKFNEAYEFQDSAIESGIWRTLPSGLKVCVASIRSVKYKEAIIRLKNARVAELNLKDPKIVDEITCKAMSQAILLDWKGAVDSVSNKPLKYSPETAEKMLIKYPKFREEVSDIATNDDNYLQSPGDTVKK